MTREEPEVEPTLDLDELEARLDLVLAELESLEHNVAEALAAHAALLAHSALRPAADLASADVSTAPPTSKAA